MTALWFGLVPGVEGGRERILTIRSGIVGRNQRRVPSRESCAMPVVVLEVMLR